MLVDPETGRELWRADGLNPTKDRNYRIIASPVVVGEVIIAPTPAAGRFIGSNLIGAQSSTGPVDDAAGGVNSEVGSSR